MDDRHRTQHRKPQTGFLLTSGNSSVVPRYRAPFASMQRMKIFRQFSPAVTLFLARMAAFSASRWHSASARKKSFRDKFCSLKTKLGCGLGLQADRIVSDI